MKLQNIHQHSGLDQKGCYITLSPQTSLINNFNLNPLISMNVNTKKTAFCMLANNDTLTSCDIGIFILYIFHFCTLKYAINNSLRKTVRH